MRPETRLLFLEKEKRFQRKKTMFYRSNLLLHSERIGYILEEYLPTAELTFGKDFQIPFARAIAKVFDDFEIDMGEINPKERVFLEINDTILEDRRKAAERELVKTANGLTIDGINYGTILAMARKRNILEAQLVHWCDGLNGFGEALHEVYAGNNSLFLEPVQSYIQKLRAFPEKNPKLANLFVSQEQYFTIPEFEMPLYPHFHSRTSIQKETGYAPYDFWKKAILKHGGEKGLSSLIQQKEFLPQQRIEQTAK